MNQFVKLYQELKSKCGRPAGQWHLWCKRPKTKKEREQVIIEAVLTQRTNWQNVEQAVSHLKKAKVYTLKDILRIDKQRLAKLIKPSGFYRAKASYLYSLAKFIMENYSSLEKMQRENPLLLRKRLLNLKGIGPETADSILLYGLDKPFFVIDEYTRRLVKRKRLSNNLAYHHLQNLFMQNLKKDYRLFQDFHALIVIAAKTNRIPQRKSVK